MDTKTLTPAPKKAKLPLDYALRCMHDAMEMVFDYDHDPNFVPSRDELVLFEMMHKQVTGYEAMLLIIVREMHERARVAMGAEAALFAVRCRKEEGSEPSVC